MSQIGEGKTKHQKLSCSSCINSRFFLHRLTNTGLANDDWLCVCVCDLNEKSWKLHGNNRTTQEYCTSSFKWMWSVIQAMRSLVNVSTRQFWKMINLFIKSTNINNNNSNKSTTTTTTTTTTTNNNHQQQQQHQHPQRQQQQQHLLQPANNH